MADYYIRRFARGEQPSDDAGETYIFAIMGAAKAAGEDKKARDRLLRTLFYNVKHPWS